MTVRFFKLTDLDLTDKRVLIREDFNVPLDEMGCMTSDARITAALPTIQYALDHKAKVILMSHLGRPKEGVFETQFSLAPVAAALTQRLNQPVPLIRDWLDGIDMSQHSIVLCENTRFNRGEKENDEALSQKIAALGDIYVNDAFATAHRREASTCGVALFAQQACAGLLLSRELEALTRILDNPTRPLMVVIGGAKASTKLKLLKTLIHLADDLVLGGCLANTFLVALGHNIGQSRYEADYVDEAIKVLEQAKQEHCEILLPTDVVVAKACSEEAQTVTKALRDITPQDIIFDIGPQSAQHIVDRTQHVKTILWNGPMGVFEMKPFEEGTKTVARGIAQSEAYSVAGGGDTLSAIEKYGITQNISYISTGGGAFLSFIEEEGRLPAVLALEEAWKRQN